MKRIIKVSVVAATLMLTGAMASDILATVDGKNVTKQDAQLFVHATAPGNNFEKLTPEQKKMITDRLVERVLFIEAAKKEGVEKTAEFKENLAKLKDELMLSLWMKTQMDNAIVSDSEAKEFYEANKNKFKIAETVHARHILVADEKTAKEIIKELKFQLLDDLFGCFFIRNKNMSGMDSLCYLELVFVGFVKLLGFTVADNGIIHLCFHPEAQHKFIFKLCQIFFELCRLLYALFFSRLYEKYTLYKTVSNHLLLLRSQFFKIIARSGSMYKKLCILLGYIFTVDCRQNIRCHCSRQHQCCCNYRNFYDSFHSFIPSI